MRLGEITSEAVYLGNMGFNDAFQIAKELLQMNNIDLTPTEMQHLGDPTEACQFRGDEKVKRYLRYFNNNPTNYWIISDRNGGESRASIAVLDKSRFLLDSATRNGYTVGKYYVYKKGGTPPKKGHSTYDEAKAEINRIRTADASERCKEFMIFKCVGINYAEIEYKEIKETEGEE